MQEYFSMKGRTALVTGSSRSMGRAIVLGFAQYGADVAINYANNHEAAEKTASECRAFGVRAVTVQADLTQSGAAPRLFTEAEEKLGRLDILVLNAAIQHMGPFTDVTSRQVEEVFRCNYLAPFELMQLALPKMAQRKWGRVLNIGSSHQAQPMSKLVSYAAMKGALHNTVICLAKDYAQYGVTINTLAPGMVDTDRHEARRAPDPKAWAEFCASLNYMKRAAVSEEMVGAAIMFCSEAGSFITGANLFATAGSHLP